MLTNEQLSAFRALLQKEKDGLVEQLSRSDHYDLERGHYHEAMGELSSYDNHPADEATDLYEREKDIALNEHTENQLKNVKIALQAIEDGSYGKCKVCGEEIPVERLEAMPTTQYCLEHRGKQMMAHNRPIEEGVLMPAFGKFEFDGQETEAYDAEDSWQDVARYGTSESPSDLAYPASHYNDMYIEEDDPVGYVEEYENFAAVDIEGNEVHVYPTKQHRKYEDELDEMGTMTAFGDLPAYEKDPYTEEEADNRTENERESYLFRSWRNEVE